MSFDKPILCINFIAIGIIFSLSIAPTESNELTKGVSSFAAEFYEVESNIPKIVWKKVQIEFLFVFFCVF